MKLNLTKENIEAGDITAQIEQIKIDKEQLRDEIRAFDPNEKRNEELFHLIDKRLSLIEKRLDEQESWVAMLIEHYVKIKREEMN